MFIPQYKLTNKILNMLTAIAEAKAIIERARIIPKQELRLRRQALIRMTHSSTKIEGNNLNIHQVEAIVEHKRIDAPARDVYEVENYLKALRYISKVVENKENITEKVILKIHHFVTDKTLPEDQSGFYRQCPIYVVSRRLGMPDEILYTGPLAKEVKGLMSSLIDFIHDSEKQNINPIIVAGVVHLEIAAIHPFADGNGRTARALATLILYKRGYDFRRLFALEDYYKKNRSEYYKAVNTGKNYKERERDITRWLEYFVEGFKEEIDNVKTQVIAMGKRKIDDSVNSQIFLDKDQIKILDFLETMGRITTKDVMDILECPRRTAQFNLQKLKKIKMIQQVGKGPSSAYVLVK
ncbi:MAG: Fic family protein [Candidatus Pacebacteria bacterium]|nr:Fic family protein [Candidatus Paceibacterota bacterium]